MSERELRAAYAETLAELAERDGRIVVLDADLAGANGTKAFKKAFPERMFDVGVAEANMVGIAAGLAAEGKIPFASTFGCFASRRCFDQFFVSANYAGLGVKLVGTDPGVTAAFNGGTHMPFEDVGMMRLVPGLTVVEPSDEASVAAFTRLLAGIGGSAYMRLHRRAVPPIYGPGERFEIGKAKVLRDGGDVTIASLGALMAREALEAAEILSRKGISAGVVDILTIKPLDFDGILGEAAKSGRLVTAENCQLAGGVGSALAERIAEDGLPIRLARIGVRDEFGEVGTQEYLQRRFGLTADRIAEEAAALAGGK